MRKEINIYNTISLFRLSRTEELELAIGILNNVQITLEKDDDNKSLLNNLIYQLIELETNM